MARLTESEREDLKHLVERPREPQPLTAEERLVAPTPETRMRYIRFATQATRFYKSDQAVRFPANDWRLLRSKQGWKILATRVAVTPPWRPAALARPCSYQVRTAFLPYGCTLRQFRTPCVFNPFPGTRFPIPALRSGTPWGGPGSGIRWCPS